LPLALYDRQLYAAVKASPSLGSLPVVGPSLAGDRAPAQLGDQHAWLDLGNIHPYTGGLAPTPSYTAAQLRRIGTVSGDKPVWATELGYYTALNAPSGSSCKPMYRRTSTCTALAPRAGRRRGRARDTCRGCADCSGGDAFYGLGGLTLWFIGGQALAFERRRPNERGVSSPAELASARS
jgi:hypothetical protein